MPDPVSVSAVQETRRGNVTAPKPRILTEKEDLTLASFNAWQNNVTFYLAQEINYVPFLTGDKQTWQKINAETDDTRGLTDHPSGHPTGATYVFYLNQMLGLMTQWLPTYIHHSIKNNSSCLEDVWTAIRKFYGIKQSEVQFMKYNEIVWEEGEKPEHLFQRMMYHLNDNLLQVGCKLNHDGVPVTKNEIMSPTTERLAVLRWMDLLHPKLWRLVQRTYAYDLNRSSLKDVQEQVSENIDSLLEELKNNEDLNVCRVHTRHRHDQDEEDDDLNVGRVQFQRRDFRQKSRESRDGRSRFSNSRSSSFQTSTASTRRSQRQFIPCRLCSDNGRASNHPMKRCRFLTKEEKEDFIGSVKLQFNDSDSEYEEESLE